MKRYKYKSKKFSNINTKRETADFIRRMAAKREITVTDMVDQIIEEWAGWKEPDENKVLDKVIEV